MRVVFDTNILVSALVFPGGQGEAALRRIIEEIDQLVLSRPILEELLDVLGRKFARDAEELAHVAVYLSDIATIVAPKQRIRAVKDEPDNRILECAVAGHTAVIVTGDKVLLTLKRYEEIRLLTLRDYLESV